MIVSVSSILQASPQKVFNELQKPALLIQVASPLLSFKPLSPNSFPEFWEEGKTHLVKLYFLKCIPLGKHEISIIKIDKVNYHLLGHEKGSIAQVWDHTVFVRDNGNGKTVITDEIEIKAGWKTIFVWIFASLFYRHRQRKWRKLAPNL